MTVKNASFHLFPPRIIIIHLQEVNNFSVKKGNIFLSLGFIKVIRPRKDESVGFCFFIIQIKFF